MKRPELLSPAGDFACAETAFDHGADAVYVGVGQFNLRAHSPNFAFQDLPELLTLAHSRNKRVYVTFNIMPDQKMLSEMELVARKMASYGNLPDALIVSDPGVVDLCREIIPDVPLHLSTQTGTFNSRSLSFWKARGISRVVLPRELTLEQITELSGASIVETEVFIHGAMCVSISGRCLLGAYIAGRHPNHGDCPQPCRFKYKIGAISNDETQTYWLDAEEESEKGVYLLNSRDLCTISIIPEIISTGVNSLKIEGRNKSAHYVASVVKTYRAALDLYFDNPQNYSVLPEWTREFDNIEHRPYTTGFFKRETALQEVFTSKASAGFRIVGIVKGILQGGVPVIDIKNSFSVSDTLEVLPVQQALSPYRLSLSGLTDLAGNAIEKTPSNRLVIAQCAQKLRIGDMIRRI